MIEKTASQFLAKLQDAATAHPALAAALASGLAGGVATAGTAARRGESAAARRLRILRNALLTAGAGGGAVALGQAAMKNFDTAVPLHEPDPVVEKITSPTARGVLAAGGIAATHNIAGRKDTTSAAQAALGEAIGNGGKPVTKGQMHGEGGRGIHRAIETKLYGNEGRVSDLEKILKKVHLGAADRELYAAGLPTATSRSPRALESLSRPTARAAYSLFGPAGRLSGSSRMLGSPLARTALGASAMFLPEAVGATSSGVKDYALTSQP